jgi:hypothetical protein
MNPQTPITLAVAVYADRQAALEDYHTIRAVKTAGEFDHIAVAVLTKRPDGRVQVDRHDSTAKHLAWGGALVGASMLVLAPVAAPAVFITSVGVGGGATTAGLAGAGGIAGHYWHNIPKSKVREMGDLLEAGDSGLIVTAVNKFGNDVSPLFAHAEKIIVDDTTKADLEALYDDAVRAATA